MKRLLFLFLLNGVLVFSISCNSNQTDESVNQDSIAIQTTDSTSATSAQADTTNNQVSVQTQAKENFPVVFVYNFHVTNRCPSCIAIEEATTKTINTYFANELKQGLLKRQVVNVDDEKNAKIAEKYQAFGSGLFVTRVYEGKEKTVDLTSDGFKLARNKEPKFIEILKNTISSSLKK